MLNKGPKVSGPRPTSDASVFDNLDALKLRPGEPGWIWDRDIPCVEIETEALRSIRQRRKARFLYLKCSLERFHIVAKLPGKALAVWALIHHRMHLTHLTEITLPSALLAEAGVGRNVKARALKDLERIGLIRVDRRPGRSLRVALVPLPEDGDRVPRRGVRAWLVIALSGGAGRCVSLPQRAS